MSPAATARKTVVNSYHGEKVTDDYQWLETGTNPVVRRWTADQNERTRRYLDALSSRPWVQKSLETLYAKGSPNFSEFSTRGSNIFFLEFRPPAQQPILKRVIGTNGPSLAETV